MKTTKSFKSLMMIAMMVISMVFTSAVFTPVDAATPKAPAKVKGVQTSGVTTDSVTITWKKISRNKNTKGYAIYRNGKKIKKVSAKQNAFTDTGLASGTKYVYKVKAYNTYKQKQYYNSKTKKWKNKKPSKKNWKGKKTRKVTKYKYGKVSAAVTITTRKPASVKISPVITSSGNATIQKGTTYDLNVRSDSSGAITYSSSNTAVATVSNGVVTGRGAGTATITINQAASGNYLSGSKAITIEVVKDLAFSNSTLPAAETHDLSEGSVTYTVKSKNGADFESSDTSIATVSTGIAAIFSNKITFKKAGVVTITVTSRASGEKKTIRLTITDNSTPAIESSDPVITTNGNATIEVGDTYALNVRSDSSGTITYTSSNSNVAAVSSTGIVTARSAGTATITISQAAKDNYRSGTKTVTITVNPKTVNDYKDFAVIGTIPKKVDASMTSLEYEVVLPADNCKVEWTSSMPDSIKVTKLNENSFKLVVYKPMPGIQVVAKNIEITGTLTNIPSGYNGPTKVTHTLENTGYPILTVNSKGNIYEVKRTNGNIYIGGFKDNGFVISNLPSGSTFIMNASEFIGYEF